MTSTRNQGRLVGLLYLLVSIPGAVALIYVPTRLIVRGDATATAANIAAHETLFRFGIGCEIVCQILFIGVALALYDLLKSVNRRQAQLMFGLIAISLPIALINELNAIAALTLIRGAGFLPTNFLSIVDQPQREVLAMFFLDLHNRGFDIAAIFWGLWLFPLGLLVYRSRAFPRILGVLLMANCFSYVINSLTSIALPQYASIVDRWLTPFGFGELIFMFWLLIIGPKPKTTHPIPA
jgi:hypothetical protein